MSSNCDGKLSITLDGYSMTTFHSMYQEFAVKMEFPDYFGHNMNALFDMLTDLCWLEFSALEISIANHPLLMSFESEDDRAAVLKLLDDVRLSWAEPIALGEWWDRPGLNFELILK